jgi:hypothetical protein
MHRGEFTEHCSNAGSKAELYLPHIAVLQRFGANFFKASAKINFSFSLLAFRLFFSEEKN